ncbi:glycosyltransferase family 2 protein [Arthrobacter sp. zg-Y820]|uniref:glycosyltransferase family 2 protein n=1 Tax=unclassified Arthrobacter TaxID=235627 RepID=UPI0024C3B20D|nr:MULTISPECIES: glycosyltransferase family 2 protein [unclassified Arthrobacter]MDK1281172.1 glycosyltransferase family 2 protein [Arthrobacter sp. zg.Y820]WIB11028.1 glycosyltransferase family 2 protein [Arthrobacter sp. zg-Y820]
MQAPSSVAVIVRTKDRPRFLERALNDIFAQTYRRFRVVIVNDGGLPESIKGVVGRLPETVREQITVVHHERSRGMEAASNAGIRSCDSEYIAIHDDDDLWHPEFLQRTVSHLDNYSDAGVVVRTNIRYEEIVGDEIRETGSEPFWGNMQQISLGEMLQINRAVPISFLYRRSLHEELGYFDEKLDVCGDWEFNIRILARHTIGFLDGQPLAFWSQRPAASGADANSIFDKEEDHRRFDRRVRDQYLRKDLAAGGMGMLLEVGRMMDDQERLLLENRRQLDAMQTHLNEALRRLEDTVTRRTSFSGILRRGGTAAEMFRGALRGKSRK